MDRLNQLRGVAGGSSDPAREISISSNEAYLSANEDSSKYFSLSEEESFVISSKDVSLASATADSETTTTDDELLPNLSPMKKTNLDSYKIGKQIEAANILSGGVDIFDDNENSYDGNELVIDDNVLDEKSNSEPKESESIDFKSDLTDPPLIETEIASKDTEVVLQIDGINVDAIDIGNGLYLYRKVGEEELAAIQITDDDKNQPSCKSLKVRENAEGNLEVYEEIEIEVPKEVASKERKITEKNTPHVPIRDINKVINDTTNNKVVDRNKSPNKESIVAASTIDQQFESKDGIECKAEVNINGKMMKFSESRKSPIIGSFAYHSTPNKEGKPLTKTMVDLQLHPNRHSDNVKKTIEVHTDNCKQKVMENNPLSKDLVEEKESDIICKGRLDVSVITLEENKDILNENKIIKLVNNDLSHKIKLEEKASAANVNNINILGQNKEINNLTEKYIDNESKAKISSENLKNISTGPVLESSNDNSNNVHLQDCSKNPEHVELKSSNLNILNNDLKEHVQSKQSDPIEKVETKQCSSETPANNVLHPHNDQIQEYNIHDKEPTIHLEHINNNKLLEKEITKENKESVNTEICVASTDTEINIGKEKDKREAQIFLSSKNEVEVKHTLIDTNKISDPKFKEGDKIKDKIDEKTSENFVEDKKLIDNKKCEIKLIKKCETIKDMVDTNEIINEKECNQSKHGDVTNTNIELDVLNKCEKHNLHKSSNFNNTEKTGKSDVLEQKQLDSVPKINNNLNLQNSKDEFKKPLNSNLDEKLVLNEKNVNKNELQHLLSGERNEVSETKETNTESMQSKVEEVSDEKNNILINKVCLDQTKNVKEIMNNQGDVKKNSAVPFGKWTEANRQEFLTKIKESKSHVNSSNNNQIKNSNDLNRRDVLKKIDKQRHSKNIASKIHELNKVIPKTETVFTNKPVLLIEESLPPSVVPNNESKIPVRAITSSLKSNDIVLKKSTRPSKVTIIGVNKKETIQRKAVRDLIDKTVEGMMIKAFPTKPAATDLKQNTGKGSIDKKISPVTLDAIEMKMNELHGIPFIERPPHELPKLHNPILKNDTKAKQDYLPDIKPSEAPNLLSTNNRKLKKFRKDNIFEVDSEEELIEHEPVTGDVEPKDLPSNFSIIEKPHADKVDILKVSKESEKKEPIITEKDFDKFVRRNSVTYENCLTVNFEEKESRSVYETIIEKDKALIPLKKNETSRIESKQKVQNLYLHKVNSTTNKGLVNEDPSNKNYHTKLQMAYQSALSAKRTQSSCPITIIEDQPVKVVFMDAKTEFIPNLLNVQGQELSPSKNTNKDEINIESATDSVDTGVMDTVDTGKIQDDFKLKTKHQRKQVLTPVDTPELELIEPSDLGIEVSPKKKRKVEDIKSDKNSMNVLHKKSYLLGRAGTEERIQNTQNSTEVKATSILDGEAITNKDTITAIDNLVKAAEMLDSQSENISTGTLSNSDNSQSTTPVKRGRGRPRKYPLPDGATSKTKVPSPQKKPRLIDAKPIKHEESVTEDEETTDEETIKENWTMGKINENIVCPICHKLFRSENVVFKHVKHCTGPSPSRSDASKRSTRRGRNSQESDDKSHEGRDEMEIDEDKTTMNIEVFSKKCKSKDTFSKTYMKKLVEDLSIKEKLHKHSEDKNDSKLPNINKTTQVRQSNNLECEFCGKTFRQLSYLVNHKLQHQKEECKIINKNSDSNKKSVFSCELGKKEFKKLHHLVQHRIIHSSDSTKLQRKNSSEQVIEKTEKEETSKQSEDLSAGFRCEPCDKSFRKLHHLVEHRETHDGINRQKGVYAEQASVEKSTPPPQCDICKKTFRKLHHLIEHREQHNETSSEKSDDKSVKSSLSTKDIIHECSLCYMVFPNEHSLNKHTVLCQRKKRQSKQPKSVNEEQIETIDGEKIQLDKVNETEDLEIVSEEVKVIDLDRNDADDDNGATIQTHTDDTIHDNKTDKTEMIDSCPSILLKQDIEVKNTETQKEANNGEIKSIIVPKVENSFEVKAIDKEVLNKIDTDQDVVKKKILPKYKMTPVEIKHQKKFSTLRTLEEETPLIESSEDEDVRYMLNPDYKPEDTLECKLFMNVRANKRSSLQIERPTSKNLITRRISLQSASKTPRFKPKSVGSKTPILKNVPSISKYEPTISTDSDDSDVKYSFPMKTVEDAPKRNEENKKLLISKQIKEIDKKTKRKSLEDKRKSLSGIAKRKSMGKSIGRQPNIKSSPTKQNKRKTMQVEHRCDCGQLFSSAALLSRHISLAHTPPRIRKRRSPAPEISAVATVKQAKDKPHSKTEKDEKMHSKDTKQIKSKQAVASRKSSIRSNTSNSDVKQTGKAKETKPCEVRKSVKSTDKVETATINKLRRVAAHKGVPVPEKMRKMIEKGKI